MEHTDQVANARKILHYLDTGTTAMAESIYRNDVTDYTCAEQLRRERESLFRRHPLLMGLGCEIPEPGDYLTDDFSGVPALLVRGEDGTVNAFMNVCRHRGAPVASGCGKGKRRFACPYHAWVYDSEGRLVRIPGDPGFATLERDAHGLRRLPVQEKYGLLWAAMTPDAPFEVDDHLQGLERDLAAYRLEGYHHYETRVIERRMNWKLVVDTFLESYHIRVLHRRTLDDILHSNVATFDAFGPNSRNIYARRSFDELRRTPEAQWDLVRHTAMVYVLFPNTIFIMQGDHVETWRIYPVGNDPERARMYVSLYTPEAPATDSARRHWDRNMDLLIAVVQEEDFPLGEKIQLGFHSGAQDHITFGRNEPGLGQYHASIKRALAAAA